MPPEAYPTETFEMGTHRQQSAGGIFFKDVLSWWLDPGGIGNAQIVNLLPQHRFPFSLAENVEPPFLKQVAGQERPGIEQAVESFLVVEPAHSNYASALRGLGWCCGRQQRGIGNHFQIGQRPPIAGILPGEDHESVETSDNPQILPASETVGKAKQPVPIVL